MTSLIPFLDLTNATLTATLAASPYGTPRPQLAVKFPKATPHRRVSAVLHMLAATAEMTTPHAERWCVQFEQTSDTTGVIYLELAEGDREEALRGLGVLRGLRPSKLAMAY